MRFFLILLVTFFVFNVSTKAQYVTIPDPALRSQLIAAYPTCFNASQMMDTTCPAIVNQTSLYIYDEPVITNWEGYQYFKNLQIAGFGATASSGDGETLPNLPATLKSLRIGFMPTLFDLPPLPPGLQRLEINDHTGVFISSLPNSITYMDLSFSDCSSLPTLPASLDTLKLYLSNLAVLPALPASLRYLDFGSTSISSLPVLPASLRYLGCTMSNLTGALPALPDSLEVLSANSNNITAVPNFPASLKSISLGGNWSLGPIPALPNGLQYLDVVNSNITSLPPLPASLTYLDISDNPGLHCLPVVPSGTNGLIITTDTAVTCIQNHPSPSYTLRFIYAYTPFPSYTEYNSDAFPVCNPVNNVYGCQVFPTMAGHVYNDYNSNGVKDGNEPYRSNVKVGLSNGIFTMTNSNGYYQISSDNIGSYTLTVTPPNYFTAVPLQYNYNFNNYDTVVTKDFPLQAIAVADDISISVLPVNAAARPGFAYPYAIYYTNIGTTTLTPNIVFNYDNTRLNYNSSTNAAVINNGSSLTLAETAMVAGAQKNFTGYFTVKPSAIIGDSIRANVSIHANAATATDSTVVRIRGAYDPNDKSATPALSTAQVANGGFIYYTVRFQNTGTDTAFNIVISDSLNGYLQPATLQVVNTSHPARVTINGDMVYCEFLNIRLPDSNVNELKSHGFITFRIKPKPTATVGTVIPNKAAIYFDYNLPIITAEAKTTIYDAAPGSHTYTFNGTGNWTTAANWVGGLVPPSILQSGDHVIINGSCILNTVVTANSSSSIIVVTGKSLFVQGNLIVQ
ncbi:MAG: hypothetical protein ABI402_09975 [Ferruginibacter sp.]